MPVLAVAPRRAGPDPGRASSQKPAWCAGRPRIPEQASRASSPRLRATGGIWSNRPPKSCRAAAGELAPAGQRREATGSSGSPSDAETQ